MEGPDIAALHDDLRLDAHHRHVDVPVLGHQDQEAIGPHLPQCGAAVLLFGLHRDVVLHLVRIEGQEVRHIDGAAHLTHLEDHLHLDAGHQ